MGFYHNFDNTQVLNLLVCLFYLLIIALAAPRYKGFSSPAFWLVGYISLASTFSLSTLGIDFGFFPALQGDGRLLQQELLTLLLALVLFQCFCIFVGMEFKRLVFFGELLFLAILIVINNKVIIFLGSVSFTFYTVFTLIQTISKTKQHTHLNRLFYWFPVLGLATINIGLVFFLKGMYASEIRFLISLSLAFLVLRFHIPDIRDFFRLTTIYLVSTVVSISIYIVGFLFTERFFGIVSGSNYLLVGAGLAVFISLIFSPISGFIRKIVNQIFWLEIYDPSKIISIYGSKISNILELNQLAAVSIGMIVQFFGIAKGCLFLVDQEISNDRIKAYKLSGARGVGVLPGINGELSVDSPIAQYFLNNRAPLLQYDIDFSPSFMEAPRSERNWLSGLGMEILVPIISKGDWIGLFTLGSKRNNRFTAEDFNLLEALASQTGTGLENARLVENLKHLNAQVREAYSSLDRANQNLAKLELTKSNFISIASHELRTPLTVARGYVEMLLDDNDLSGSQREMLLGIHKSILRQHEIMDSMFDIAQLDSRSVELQHQDVFLAEIINSIIQEFSELIKERQQFIIVDIPHLPAIKADADSIRKLFMHLIVNAIKFTPNAGKIKITALSLQPNNRELPEGGVEIIVSDTGIGVDKDLQEIIFTKFYQPGELINRHSTGKTKFKGSGTGLGLALSRGIVEAHGGRIWVDSEGVDEVKLPGSNFHVILPIRQQGESKTIRMGNAIKWEK